MTETPEASSSEPLLPSMPGGQPYDEAGVDITLIQMMLALTPHERLELVRQWTEAVERMRHANATVQSAGDPQQPGTA